MKRLNHSIRTQLIVVTIIFLLVLASTLEVIHTSQQRDVLINSERRVGLTLIRSVNNTINSVRSFISTLRDIEELNTRLAELVQLNANIDFIAVTDAAGYAIFHSTDAYEGIRIAELAQLPSDTTALKNVPGFGEVYLTLESFDSTDLTEPNQYRIIVASASEPISNQLFNAAVSSILATALFTVAVASLMIIFLQHYFVRPLEHLTKAANAIKAGALDTQVHSRQNNEIGQLANAFNSMTHQLIQKIAELDQHVKELDKTNQALRVATAKAREAARIKGEFLSTMSHELRTPLNAIIGFSDMLLMGMSGPLSDIQTHKIKRLQENGKRLLNLVNDSLDLTRIEAGRIELESTAFSPPDLAKRVVAQMAVLAEQNQLAFEVKVDPALPSTLLGDPRRIEQVIVNLLSNAFKFTDKGSVTLRMDANSGDQTWRIAVTDTGIGIPPHAFDLIFEEFRQLDGSMRRVYKGTGLGLAITRQLCRVMGGNITVESTLGVGSTFTVALPMTIAESENAVAVLPTGV
jgi:signal transduction histidine kinase